MNDEDLTDIVQKLTLDTIDCFTKRLDDHPVIKSESVVVGSAIVGISSILLKSYISSLGELSIESKAKMLDGLLQKIESAVQKMYEIT